MRNPGLLAAAMSIFAASSVCAQNVITISVGPGGQYAHVADAVAFANSDGNFGNYYVLNLVPGTYLNDFAEIDRPMTIQTDPVFTPKRAVLKATQPLPNEKGILLVLASLTVRNLVFTGAQIDNSLGGNGAAIRDQNPEGTPASLVVENSVFHDNQAAILQGDDAAETVTIVNSVFRNNGNPDICCFTHGVYVDEAASLTVAGSLFCGQLIGHDIKSRAQQTAVIGNHIYSGEGAPANSGCRVGNTSLDVDLANGGVGLIWGNTLVQGPSAQNHKIIDYGEEGLAFATNSLVIARNAFTSTTQSLGIYDSKCVPAELAANTFVGLGQIIDPASCIAPGEPGP